MSAESDKQLARQAATGDRAALERLFRRHYATIYAFAQKICGDPIVAEDITQDVVVKLMGSIGTFDGRSAFTSWLYRVVLTKALDYRRKEFRRTRLKQAFGKLSDTTDPPRQEASVTASQLWDLLLQLPASERDVAILVLGEGLTHRETAEILDCPIGTVGWRLNKAVTLLNRKLEREDDEQTGTQSALERLESPAALS